MTHGTHSHSAEDGKEEHWICDIRDKERFLERDTCSSEIKQKGVTIPEVIKAGISRERCTEN